MSGLPSPNQPNRLPIWFLLLLGLGGPIAAGLTIAQTITQHLWEALVIALLYVAIVLVLSIMTKIWEQLENNWVNQIVTWINTPLNYQKRYCQWLIRQHNQFDVGGLSIYDTPSPTLDQIFVELNLVKKPPYQISSAKFEASEANNEFKAPKATIEYPHPISDYLGLDHLVLLGLPGSGKTTLLKNLGLTLIDRRKRRRTPKIPYKLPFFLPLRDYGNTIKEMEQFSLVDAIQTPLHQWNRSAPPGWVEDCLNKGGCLILLDGLDEVPDEETRLVMVEWVHQQMITYGDNNRFILTSRPSGYLNNPLNGVIVLEVQGFTYRQIEKFVHNWYHAEETNRLRHVFGSFENARLGAEDFLGMLKKNPTLFDLASNPLLLTMSIMVHRYRGALPGSRGELYKEICDVFLGGRQRAKGLRLELSSEQNQQILQPLAFYMMKEKKTELTLAEAQSIIEEPLKSVSTQLEPQAFLKIIEDRNFWVKQGLDVYGFAHLSFQEYLAAMNVKEKNLKHVLVDQIGSSWWRETIILYCNRADASPILKACLTGKLSVPALQLALECEEAASHSSSIDDPSVRTLFDRVLIQGAEDPNPEVQQIVAKARLAQRIKGMNPLDDEVYATKSLISCAEYQLFLDEQQQQGKYYQPDHWTNERFSSGQALAPVLGVRPSDATAFCTWLTERDHENWRYRLPYTNELKKIEAIVTVAAGTGYWTNEDEGFVWAKGDPPLPGGVTQEYLDQCIASDANRVSNYPLNLDKPKHRDLADHITITCNIVNARDLKDKLVRILTSTRNHIRDHEHDLRTQLARAHERRATLNTQLVEARQQESNLQNRLANAQQQESNLRTQLARTQQQASNLKKRLANAQQQTSNLKNRLARAQQQASNLKNRLARIYRSKRKSQLRTQLAKAQGQESNLRTQHSYVQGQKSALRTRHSYVQGQKSNLQTQLARAQERKSNLQAKLASMRADKQKSNLQAKRAEAQEQENNLQAKLNHFSTHARAFYSIYDRFLVFTPTSNSAEALSSALSRNNVLNLDRVLAHINDETSEVLNHVSSLVSTFARELTLSLTDYRNNHDNTQSNDLSLAQQLSQIPFSENVQSLALFLRRYLNYLSEHRPFGKGRSPTRLYIRYFARELALHSSYWFWKELFSDTKQSSNFIKSVVQPTIDAYFDLYVAFAILEGRIEGKLPASEGIIIVKERLEEN